jgi:hypothetical protein
MTPISGGFANKAQKLEVVHNISSISVCVRPWAMYSLKAKISKVSATKIS